MNQHKASLFDGFTRKYKVDRLMYFETYSDPRMAAEREQQIKGWRREKKIALFAESNPQWKDLAPAIFETVGVPHPLLRVRDFRKRPIQDEATP